MKTQNQTRNEFGVAVYDGTPKPPATVQVLPRNGQRRTDIMAKNQTTTQVAKEASRGRGRPPKDSADARSPQEVAVANLQYSMDRACVFLMDGNNSVASRAARAARAGVPRATVDKALSALEAALQDCQEAIQRAYAAPAEKPRVERRVDLTA